MGHWRDVLKIMKNKRIQRLTLFNIKRTKRKQDKNMSSNERAQKRGLYKKNVDSEKAFWWVGSLMRELKIHLSVQSTRKGVAGLLASKYEYDCLVVITGNVILDSRKWLKLLNFENI